MTLPSKNDLQNNTLVANNSTSFWQDDTYGLETTNTTFEQQLDSFADTDLFESEQSVAPRSLDGEDNYSELVFIDSGVPDSRTLIDNISGVSDVVVLNEEQDEIVQIGEHLDNYQQLDAIHIVSLGESGQLSFANSVLNSDTIGQYRGLLESWRNSLDVDADIVLYGCDVSFGQSGNSFVRHLARVTKADVLASVDQTGSGGDWELETQFGKVETPSIFKPEVATAYQHTLDEGDFGFIPDSGVDFGAGIDDTGVDFGEVDPSALLLLPDVDIDGDGEDFEFSELEPGDLAEFDYKNVPASDLEILTTEEGLSFSEFNAEDFAQLDINNIPAENIKIMADAGLDIASYDTETLSGVKLGVVETFGYINEDVFSIERFNEDTTFGELSSAVVANANLFDYKGENLNLEDGFSVSETQQLDFNDYKAIDFAFDGDEIFDSSYYLESNPDVADNGINPFTQYFFSGAYAPEFRDPSTFFDSSFYLESYSDVADDGINPLFHYFNSGASAPEFRDPDPAFDTSFYLESYPDVADDGINPLFHYFNRGADEGRYSNETFKTLEESGAWVVSPDLKGEQFDDFKDAATKQFGLGKDKESGLDPFGLLWSVTVGTVDYVFSGQFTEDALEQADNLQQLVEDIKVFVFPGDEPLNDGGSIEIFNPPDVDTGTEPFDLGESIILEDNTFFPKDGFLEALLNGRFEFPDEGERGSYFLAIEGGTGLYTPQNAGILLNSQENITLELFGGSKGQLPGAINVDIIAEQGIRADLLTDGLSFIPDNSVEEIVTFNPFIPKDAGGTGILDYLPEAARVLEPGGQIIINGTTNNKFTKVKQSLDLESLGLQVVEKQVPLLDRFSDLEFRTIDGNNIRKDRIKTTILEKI